MILGDSAEPATACVAAAEVRPTRQLELQARLQRSVDTAISKPMSMPANYSVEDFRADYQRTYQLGLKGCAILRPNPVTGRYRSRTTRGADKKAEPVVTSAPSPNISHSNTK